MSWIYGLMPKRRSSQAQAPAAGRFESILGAGGISIALSIEAGLPPSEEAVRLAADAFHSYVQRQKDDGTRDVAKFELGNEAGAHLLSAARQVGSSVIAGVASDLETLVALS